MADFPGLTSQYKGKVMASPVLLGLVDEVAGPQATTWDVSKIGGKPDWMTVDLIDTIRCHHCQCLRLLVCQIYCPLENSPYHRTLYLLICASATCRNLPHRWIVLRCQTLDTSFKVDKHTGGSSVILNASLALGQGDLGHHKTESAVPMVTQDWCEDEDDWGDDDSENTALSSEKMKQNKIATSEFQNPCQLSNEPSARDEGCGDCGVASDLQGLSIDDVDNDDSGNGIIPVEQCFAEEFSSEPCSDIPDLLVDSSNVKSEGSSGIKPDLDFISYYMSVIDEPSADEIEQMQHERNLLKEYSKREGVDLRQFADVSFEERKGGGKTGGEKYERTEVCHGDRMFHKFMKKVSGCPQQILRYIWNGNPLMIRPLASHAVSHCDSCGSQRVFELQLMPSLVNVLKHHELSDAAVEFGTVLIYSCKNSCWADGDTYKTEQFIVQDDPDQHLFKR